MLGRVLEQLQYYGVREVIINLHHHAEQLARWLGDGRQWGMRLHLSHEAEILDTAGGIKRVETLLQGEPFLVCNADVLIDLDLQALWQWHCQRGALVTMVVRPDPAARAYGAVIVDSTQRVLQISGRPAAIQAIGRETIFTGVQVLSPEIFSWIPPACRMSTTADIYPALLAQGQAVYGYWHTGYWLDVGVPTRYLQAHRDVLNGMLGASWRGRLPAGSRIIDQHLSGAADRPYGALLPPVVLGPGVSLAPGAQVGPYTVLGAGCQVGTQAEIRNSVLWERVQVGDGARIYRSILGADVHVAAASVLSQAVHCILPV
jgi:NDP-sugar pyrophosphorylase family protein